MTIALLGPRMSQDNPTSNFIDFYEFLMVSPDADKPMIEWAVRLLATRFGKKNGEYVDEAKYNLVRLAFRTLSDPGKRAAFDKLRAQREAAGGTQGPKGKAAKSEAEDESAPPTDPGMAALRRTPDEIKIPNRSTAEDTRTQKRLRQGIVAALYDILVHRPRNPELGRAEIARVTGVLNDDLEFPVWYLREKDILRTTPAGLYTLTAKGVEWAENGGVEHLQIETPAAKAAPTEPGQEQTAHVPAPKMNETPVLAQTGAPQQVA